MTTKITITNDVTSNGDVMIRAANTWTPAGSPNKPQRVLPGESVEVGITDYSLVLITEEWPTTKPKEAAPTIEGLDPAKEAGA